MITMAKRYECNACKKVSYTDPDKEIEGWIPGTEVGDLCPACARSWETFKQSFIERMRLESGEVVINQK